jgi:hypothetical protein
MAGPILANHSEITVVGTKNNTTELTQSINEKASQTFIKGTPVMLASGVVQAWDGTTITAGIAGVSNEDAHNLGSDGLGAPGAFTPVGFPGTGTTFGSVPYEPSAVNIPLGAPFVIGQINFAEANLETVFMAQCDSSAGSPAATPTQATLGAQFGLTKDTNGHWYIDFNKVTVGTNTVLIINGFTIDGLIQCARLLFTFTKTALQLYPN